MLELWDQTLAGTASSNHVSSTRPLGGLDLSEFANFADLSVVAADMMLDAARHDSKQTGDYADRRFLLHCRDGACRAVRDERPDGDGYRSGD